MYTAQNVLQCDYCHGCISLDFDTDFEVVNTEEGDFAKCGTCTGAKRSIRRVLTRNLKVGMKIQFSGSTWTVVSIEDGKVYGIGGNTMFGHKAINPVHLLNIRPNSYSNVDQVI